MEDQKGIVAGEGDLGGTMRLGCIRRVLGRGTLARRLYGAERVDERHRHRYEVNNAYREQLARQGWCSRACRRTVSLVEYVELPRDVHPYFVATQAHPELRSRPTRAHPLFVGLVEAPLARQQETRLPVEVEPATRRRRDRRVGATGEHRIPPAPKLLTARTMAGRGSEAVVCGPRGVIAVRQDHVRRLPTGPSSSVTSSFTPGR